MKSKIAIFFISIVISLMFGEYFCRTVFGDRLVMHFENSGLYYFKPHQNGWYLLNYPSAHINNLGARGDNIAISAIHEKEKFIFLGDSFTFGWLLSDEETIPHFFMKEMNLSGGEVLNFGNGGFGIDHMIAMYRYWLNLFSEGDTVIVIIPEIDFYRTMTPFQRNILKTVFWKIREKSSFISWSYVVLRNWGLHVKSFLEEKIFPLPAHGLPATTKKSLDDFSFERSLLGLVDLVHSKKQKLIFVFYSFEKTDYSDKSQAFCKKHQLTCMTEIWRYADDIVKRGGEIYAPDYAHPSSLLNQNVGKAIAQFVRRNFEYESEIRKNR